MGVSGTLFWVDGAEWSIVLGGWEWVGMSGGGGGVLALFDNAHYY